MKKACIVSFPLRSTVRHLLERLFVGSDDASLCIIVSRLSKLKSRVRSWNHFSFLLHLSRRRRMAQRERRVYARA